MVFGLAELLSYYLMISISEVVLTPLLQLFEDRIVGILVADGIGIGVVIFIYIYKLDCAFKKKEN